MTGPIRPLAAAVALALLTACGSNPNWQVTRVPAETTVDYDYRFDDEDARSVYRGLVADALSKPWLDRWAGANGSGRPLVVLGTIRNDTEDYINTHLITDRFREELLNSGRVRIKAARDFRKDIREERLDTEFNDPETVKAAAKEVNADFIMLGRIKDVKERSADRKRISNYYEVTMELIDAESAEVVWIQTEEIKKVARRQ